MIKITYPDSVRMTSKFDCKVKGPRTSSSLCSISTISQQILVENAFVGWTTGYDDEITISKAYF